MFQPLSFQEKKHSRGIVISVHMERFSDSLVQWAVLLGLAITHDLSLRPTVGKRNQGPFDFWYEVGIHPMQFGSVRFPMSFIY